MKFYQELEYLEQHEFDRSVRLLKEAGELGLLGADVPEEYGGIGLDKVSSALIAEKFSRAGGFAITHGAHVGIGYYRSFYSVMKSKETIFTATCNR